MYFIYRRDMNNCDQESELQQNGFLISVYYFAVKTFVKLGNGGAHL